MQLDRKVLAFGQFPATKGDLYVPASGRKGLVHNILIHNTNTSAETVVLNYHDGTNEHEILNQSVAASDSLFLDFKGEGELVDDGGKITGNTTTAAKVTHKFSGTEEIPDAIAGGGSVAGVSSNLWVPPSTAHAEDDEFEAATLSGWDGVENLSDATSGTFSYDTVDPYDTTFNSGNAVRVTANPTDRPSWALIQVPSRDKFYCIYKSYTLPTNLLVVARMKFNMRGVVIANDSGIGISLQELSTGKPTLNSRLTVFLNEADTGAAQAQSESRSSVGGLDSAETTNVSAEGQALQYVAIHKIGTTYHAWFGTADGNWIWLDSYSGLDYTPDSVGIVGLNNSVSAPGVMVGAIDFIRFFETDKFLL